MDTILGLGMLLKALILGLVEGVTEYIPVSSTGHMIIVDDMWLRSEEFLTKYGANTFKVVIQLGSILAVVIHFWDRFMGLLGLSRRHEVLRGRGGGLPLGRRNKLTLGKVIVGLLPAGVLGLAFKDFIDDYLFSTQTVLWALVIGALLMILADRVASRNATHIKTQTVDDVTYGQAFLVGLFQCLSLWPGFSRSGATISGGVLLGMSHRAAADFTFIMAVPIMFGASLVSLLKNWEYITLEMLPFFVAGFISAFVFAWLSVGFFLKVISKVKLLPFAIYRIVLAIVIWLVYF